MLLSKKLGNEFNFPPESSQGVNLIELPNKNAAARSSVRIPVIKITNFPWELTKDDVEAFLCDYNIQDCSIHIPIDKSTGKTRNETFVEMNELADVEKCVATLNRKMLKGRQVSVQSSSFTELFNTHFPFAVSEQNIFLTKEEINSLLVVCKNYKMHFSRRCAQRPFEHICSLLYLLPWKIVNISNRDLIFELVKQCLEALLFHISKPMSSLTAGTLDRYLKASLSFPIFTEKQKKILQQMADVPQSMAVGTQKESIMACESNQFSSELGKDFLTDSQLNDSLSSRIQILEEELIKLKFLIENNKK